MPAEKSPYQRYEGYRKAIGAILDAVDAKKGRIPTTIRLVELSLQDLREIKIAFWRNHIDAESGSARLHVGRIIRDLYEGDEERAIDTWYATLGRVRDHADMAWMNERDDLLASFDSETSEPAEEIRDLLAQQRGWPTRTLRQEGLATAISVVRDYLTILKAIPAETPTPLRTFSSRVIRNSKALDPGERLYRLVGDHLSSEEDAEDREEARRKAFEDANLVESFTSSVVYVSGDVRLTDPSAPDEPEFFVSKNHERHRPSVLTLQQVREYGLTAPDAIAILSIENEVPFEELVKAQIPKIVLVCTRGQPTVATRELIACLAREAPVVHWGDIDAGGMRILRSLQRIAGVKSILMDAPTVFRYRERVTKFSEEKRDQTERAARRDHTLALGACLEVGGWLEQEAIPIEEAVLALEGRIPRTFQATRVQESLEQ